MPKTAERMVNIHEAKTHLSRLIDEVEQGNSFTIAKSGKPRRGWFRSAKARKDTLKRRFGFMKGIFTAPEDIKAPFANEIEEMFYGAE